ncbi:hypothetical protein [Cytophaga hutchinsonii]|uniref:Uncharacterized protein n=1 Tax=Cytophaga hutchinsonii (strain ATCC 33406 / DSM 1761 / CIP 103989 / NBRC 15051 / NCIMB 9469 / D465) TaxID=269798 RepID=A0A6N4SR40_CYTH3|nr:hypothetical protein [Cytophaga hutchinsonii]ABG58797.1 conserved hypothetical protein [Cytophaga hutchinsonii ATCC 33406]SFX62087.1 hypothetical protein SAMN04487930_106190 [Cytophaga hutchinsonii ATCC 33406]
MINLIENQIIEQFLNSKDKLISDTKSFACKIYDSYDRFFLESISSFVYPNFRLERDDLLCNIDKAFKDFKFEGFNKRIDKRSGYYDNEIKFINPLNDSIRIKNPNDGIILRNQQMLRLKISIDEFFNCQQNQILIKKMPDFDFFIPTVITEDQLKSGNKLGTIINAKGLIAYVKEIFKLKLINYKYAPQISTEKKIRFEKVLSQTHKIVVEYDFTEEFRYMNRGQFEFPLYLHTYIYNFIDNDTQELFEKNRISLGIAEHPLFSVPIVNIVQYYLRLWNFKEHENYIEKIKNEVVYNIYREKNSDGTFTSYYPKEIGEREKKFILFYLSFVANSSSIYLDFLSNILRGTGKW